MLFVSQLLINQSIQPHDYLLKGAQNLLQQPVVWLPDLWCDVTSFLREGFICLLLPSESSVTQQIHTGPVLVIGLEELEYTDFFPPSSLFLPGCIS